MAAIVTRAIESPIRAVWEVLADGWLYPLWVVGAARARDVNDDWPVVGSRLHHSFGVWPVLVDDTTEVLAVDPGRHLRLQARGWPAGEAQVDIRLDEAGPERTRVSMEERAVRGPGVLVPNLVEQPLVAWRNREALRRLSLLAEGRAAHPERNDPMNPHRSKRDVT